MSSTNILDMRNVDKSFDGVPVLNKVNFSLRPGEIHALVGENGAGKSTLMKILHGVHSPNAGEIRLDDRPVRFERPRDAEEHGIVMIFQELSLIPTLTVAQNIFLTYEPRYTGRVFISDREAERRAGAILSDLGENIDPHATVGSLSVGASQMVEIAKALSKNARILVMDEPTSALSDEESQNLFRLIRQLRADGISVIYISHRMTEIFEICDRITVLRDGTDVLSENAANVSMRRLINAMLGEESEAALEWRPRNYEQGKKPVIEVRNLCLAGRIKEVSFSLSPGEIVGLAGLTGSGRTEIAESIFGLRRRDGGEIRIDGRRIRNTQEAILAGAALVPENRRTQGLVLEHTLRANFMLPSLKRFLRGLFVNDHAGRRAATKYIERLKIDTEGPEKVVRLLSGGNQQKIVLAKWLERNPRLLILDEPTIGVDIGAKTDIVEIVRSIADQGTAVLVISSEFEELLAMSDRILILRDGRVIREMNRQDVESEEALHHAVQG